MIEKLISPVLIEQGSLASLRSPKSDRLLARIFDDVAHSADERREIIIGHSSRQRLLVVSFAERQDSVRIISARKATRLELHDYEEATGS